jgi:hypothetical protein
VINFPCTVTGSCSFQWVAANDPANGNVWAGLAQSFTAENPHVKFGFYAANFSGTAISDTVLFSLYSGSGQFSALIAQASATATLAEDAGELLQVAFSSVSLTPGEQYTVAVTLPDETLPVAGEPGVFTMRTGVYSSLGVFIYSQDNAYSGGQFYYVGGSYPESEFENWDLAFNVTPVAKMSSMNCPAGPNGPGGSYNPTEAYCLNGAIVPLGHSLCAAGTGGNGGDYDPNLESCVNGSIANIPTPPGLSVCPAGTDGQGGFYSKSQAACRGGVIVPAGDKFCVPGKDGDGGLYVPTQATCSKGVVVPDGDSYCGPGKDGPGGIYGSTCTCSDGKITCTGALGSGTTQLGRRGAASAVLAYCPR